jgi:hypothetical protein
MGLYSQVAHTVQAHLSSCNVFKYFTCIAPTQASLIAEELLAHNPDAIRIVFNKFRSAISFKPTVATILSPEVQSANFLVKTSLLAPRSWLQPILSGFDCFPYTHSHGGAVINSAGMASFDLQYR